MQSASPKVDIDPAYRINEVNSAGWMLRLRKSDYDNGSDNSSDSYAMIEGGPHGFDRHGRYLAIGGYCDAAQVRLMHAAPDLLDALRTADEAIREMFRYFDGGETRGSYDGRPERDQLRRAGHITRAALAKATAA